MSILVFLPMYILANKSLDGRIIIRFIITGVLLFLSFPIILKLVLITPYGTAYSGTWLDISLSLSSIQNLAFRLLILTGCLILAKKTIFKYPEMKYYYNIVIYCTLIQILAVQSSLFGRLTTVFFIGYIILIPAVLRANFKAQLYRISISSIVVLMLIYQYVYFNSSNGAIAGGYSVYEFSRSGLSNE